MWPSRPPARQYPDAWPPPAPASEKAAHRPGPPQPRALPANAAAPHAKAAHRPQAPTNPSYRPAPPRAPRPTLHATARATAQGNRTLHPCMKPDADRAFPTTPARRTKSHPPGSSPAAPAIQSACPRRIADCPIIAGNIRKSLEIQIIVELQPTGLAALVTACNQTQAIARNNRRAQRRPQLDHPHACLVNIALDRPAQARRLAAVHAQKPMPKPRRGKACQGRKPKHPALLNLFNRHVGKISGHGHIEPTGPVTQDSRTRLLVNPPHRPVQNIRQPSQLGLEGPTGTAQLANAAAKLQLTCADIGPIDQPRTHLGPVIASRLDIRLADRGIAQRSQSLGIIDRKPRALLQGQGTQARVGLEGDALELQSAIMVCEPQRHAI